jgi:uncharacterized membrane protein YbhN (UPF0104 family)
VLWIANQAVRGAYWQTILAPISRVPFATTFRYTIDANTASTVLPARGGEALRVWWLNKNDGIALPVLAAAVAYEKMIDATVLVLAATPLPWLLVSKTWLAPVKLLIPVGLLGLPLAVFLARRLKDRIRWLASVRVFDTLTPLFVGFAWVIAAWALDMGVIALVMDSVSVPVRIEAVLLVVMLVNLAVAVGGAPGNVGSFELGAAFALTTLGVADEKGAAFGMLYHLVQVVPLLLVWLAGRALGWGRGTSPLRAGPPPPE